MTRRTWALCLVSASLGAVLAIAAREQGSPQPAQAQPASASGSRIQSPRDQPRRDNAVGRPRPADDLADLTPEERTHVEVYEATNRGVVHINTKSVRADGLFFEETVPVEGSGSGSILDAQGHVLTNFHVVEGARQVFVTLYDGKTYDAEIIGQDATTDIAVLRIESPPAELHPLPLADSSRLRVGQRVYAIGNPFGLERTLTTGIVSSLNREIPSRNSRTIKSVIQIDAAINPGNSGGPLLDTRGKMIGMNTAIASKTGQSAGVGFAIPAATIERIVPQLLRNGRVIRPEVGIAGAFPTDQGLRIARLTPGGPAERAGLRGPRVVRQRRGPFVLEGVDRSAADLIVAVDGQPVHDVDEFLTAIESKQPGDRVLIRVQREGQMLDVPVVLAGSEEGEV